MICATKVPFWSNAKEPHCKLSNFAKKIKCRGFYITWPDDEDIPKHLRNKRCKYTTREHAYVALKAADAQTAKMFTRLNKFDHWGVFKTWPKSLKTTVDIKTKKKNYWNRKGNKGIIAKMVANLKPNIAKKHFNADMKEIPFNILFNDERHYKLWKVIFEAWFSKDSEEAEILKKTCGKELCEFSRMANEHTVWACKFDECGNVVGHNLMGKFLTRFRIEIFGS